MRRTDGLGLDAVGELEVQMFNKPQKFNRSTNAEFTTSAPIAFKPLLAAAHFLSIVFRFYFANSPHTIPPISPSPSIGAYCLVTIASGKLKTSPTRPPLSQLGIGSSILKIIKPIANLLINEAVIALVLSSNVIKNIGIIETIPKIVPTISPLIILFICLFF